MSNITETWENTRIAYQQRYIMWIKRWHNYHNEDDRARQKFGGGISCN